MAARFETGKLRRSGGEAPFACLRAANGAARRAGFGSSEVIAFGGPLLLPATPLVHMRIDRALDLVFLSRSGQVKRILHRVQPSWKHYGAFGWSCLELPAGQAELLGLQLGETLSFER